jgi:hypothetical protein
MKKIEYNLLDLNFTEENEVEGYFKCIQNPHIWIVLAMYFPMIGGMPRGSSWLRIYSLMKLQAPKNG